MTIALLPALGTPLLTVLSGGLPVPSGGYGPLSAPMLPLARPVPAVLFLPLALAPLAWPAIAHWTRPVS
jgi:hypothetical protein